MKRRSYLRRAAWTVGAVLAMTSALSACGDDDKAATTTTPAPTTTTMPATTVAPTTTEAPEATAPDYTSLESLSYLIQGLLTTDQIGGGWVDRGRILVPPGSDQRGGFLCPEGQAIADPLGSTFDPLVSASYRGETEVTAFESLLWGEQQRIKDNFTTWKSAVDICAGKQWETADLGTVGIELLDLQPSFAYPSIAFALGPAEKGNDPWFESHGIEILLWEGSSEVAVVLQVGMTIAHSPSEAEVPQIDDAELLRIAETAVARLEEGL